MVKTLWNAYQQTKNIAKVQTWFYRAARVTVFLHRAEQNGIADFRVRYESFVMSVVQNNQAQIA